MVDRQLTNGIRVLIAPNMKTPLVEIAFALPFGSWAETEPGAASIALSTVAKATALHDEKALAEELDRYAIHVSAFASHDESRVQLSCLADAVERGFSLLGEIVKQPAFPERAFKTVLNQTATELKIAESDPASLADQELWKQIFPGHPYGLRVTGESSDLTKLRRADAADFWSRIARPEHARLIMSGALTEERGLQLAKRFFESWSPVRTVPFQKPSPFVANPHPNRIFLRNWPGAGQTEIRMGCAGLAYADRDAPVANLVSSYFGGSYGSRLMKALRIDKGSTYSSHGGFELRRFAGAFTVSTFTKTDSTAETMRTMLSQLQELCEQPPSPAELNMHRQAFVGSAAARLETPGQLVNELARITLNDLPLEYLQRRFAIIASANADQCDALVHRFINPTNLVIVVVGDSARLTNQLQSIAPITLLQRE